MSTVFKLLGLFAGWLAVYLLTACQLDPAPLPTLAAAAGTATLPGAQPTLPPDLPPTWTPEPVTEVVEPEAVTQPTWTPRPTNTPWPTFTASPPATNTPPSTPTETADVPADEVDHPPTLPPATATAPPPAPGAANLLPNPSFEDGWYHVDGLPELQVPNQWLLEWDAGANPLDPDPWNAFVRPESRVLPRDFLPPSEHALFIWDGRHTVKIFKGAGAISFRLLTNVYLEPGTYLFEINFFPDLVDEYLADGSKIWAPDPLSGEVRFVVGDGGSGWTLPAFGRKNTLSHVFEVTSGQNVRLGAAFRGRWAIANNGWFLDDWSLRRLN